MALTNYSICSGTHAASGKISSKFEVTLGD